MNWREYLPAVVRQRFLSKLGLALLFVLVVVGGASGVVIAETDTTVGSDVRHEQQVNAETQSVVIGNWVETLQRQSIAVGYTDTIQEGKQSQINMFLSNTVENESFEDSIVGMHYVDADTGTIRASSADALVGANVSKIGYDSPDSLATLTTDGPQGQQSVVSRPHQSPAASQPVVGVATPVRGQSDRVLVVVGGIVSFADRLPQRDSNSFIKVVDDRGTVVLSQRPDQILSQNMGPADNQQIESMAVKKGLSGKSGYMQMDMGGTTMTMGYAPITGVDWTIMYHEPYSSAFAVQQSVFRNLLVLLGVSMGGIIIAGLVIFRMTIPPLTRLTERAKAIESGQLDVTIHSDRIDEFGQAFEAVGGMRTTLEKKINTAETEREEAKRERKRAEEAKREAEEATREAEQAQSESEQLAQTLERKANEFSTVMTRGAEGDLTARMESDGQHEAMDEIAESYNQMMEELQALITEIESAAEDVADSIHVVNTSATEVERASKDVSGNMQTILERSRQQDTTIQDSADELANLSAMIEEIASSTDDISTRSAQAADRGTEGRTRANRAIDQMEAIETTTEEAIAEIEQLDAEMAQIIEIVDLIDDIAEQTNILALNASIEAARAGGASDGSGFTVVAQEVKQLAEETATQTDQIEARIDEVKSTTESIVGNMREMGTQVSDGKSAVESTAETLELIVDDVEEVNESLQSITTATDEQAAAVEQTVRMIEDAGDMSEETVEEAGEVAAAAEEQTASLSEVAANVDRISDRAAELGSVVSEFETHDSTQRDRQAMIRHN